MTSLLCMTIYFFLVFVERYGGHVIVFIVKKMCLLSIKCVRLCWCWFMVRQMCIYNFGVLVFSGWWTVKLPQAHTWTTHINLANMFIFHRFYRLSELTAHSHDYLTLFPNFSVFRKTEDHITVLIVGQLEAMLVCKGHSNGKLSGKV